MVLVVLALAVGIGWYERGRPSSKLVALVGALAALALAGRVLFTPIPNVQATTDIVLLSGYALGPAPGFVVGSLGALTSNFMLGQGPWTPWQMLGWGMAGAGGGALALLLGRQLGRWPLALACAAAGFVFGAWMDLFTLLYFTAEQTSGSYLAVAGVSLPFNVAHAVGNAVLCLAFGPGFVRTLARFRRRLDVRWMPGGQVAAGAGVLALAFCLTLPAPPPAEAASGSAALRYLERAQNADGGFGAAPGQASSQLITGWSVLGLEAGGRNPLDVSRGGRTPVDFMRERARELNDTGELERTILSVRGAGLDPRRFAGRDLVAELLRRRRADGSYERLPNLTAFAVLALRAAGRPAKSPPVASAVRWLTAHQNDDGGFSLSGKGASFVDETAAVLQALAAGGKRDGRAAKRAVSFLRTAQAEDGGYGQSRGYRANAQSTAWAVQGIVAAGEDPSTFKRKGARSPVAYLGSLQQADGSYRYSRSSEQTPVWVTAQVVTALRRKPFPLRPVKRAAKSAEPVPRHTRRPRKRPRRAPARPARAGERRSEAPVPVRSTSGAAQPVAAKDDSGDGPSPVLFILLPAAAIALGVWLGRRRARQRRRGGDPPV
jgi:Squalene-hopene cyclase C-terminal domain/ECF-type riboflavin transporter, S component/Prenyltransferase and squalene oxidase repeat